MSRTTIAIVALAAIALSLLPDRCYRTEAETHFTLETYEDGSFVLFEHGDRIGTGCLDNQPCQD